MRTHLAILACALAPLCAVAQDTQITWETLGNDAGTYTQRIVVKGDMTFDRLGFNIFARPMTAVNKADVITELVPGYYTLKSKRFHQGADSVVVDIVTKGSFGSCSYAPDGFHRIERDGSTKPVKYERREVCEPKQWSTPVGADHMPYGYAIFDINAHLAGGSCDVYDVIPSYKNVSLTSGTSSASPAIRTAIDSAMQPGHYTLKLADDVLTVTASDDATATQAIASFKAQVLDSAKGALPNVIIEDYPDFEYRGVMIDVARNFQDINTMKRIVDDMAVYRMNRLHFHFVDDEAWRIEIAPLPELTSYSARRGYSKGERDNIYQIFSGDGNPDTPGGPSNGYYTREQFVDFLKYAHERGISVIPEIEMPGHARAAIRAMEKRYRDTSDKSLRLIHDGDKSVYTSAQSFHDNVVNPALESTYRFFDVVFDEIISMYREAGVPLLSIHIGGDEVARGAWDGSKLAQKLIAEQGLNGQTGLHGYFVERIAAMLESKGVDMSGWQEIAVGHTPQYNEKMAPMTYSVNCWTQSSTDPQKSITRKALDAGFPVVISNVNNFYLDMCYNQHPEEPGLKWGGVVDEFQSLHGYPMQMFPGSDAPGQGKVVGLSGHLFAETLRSEPMLQMYIFPKMLGLAERAWNADSTYTDADFNAVIYHRQMPRWDASGRNYHLRQPGIKVIDGSISMNSPYPGAEIRYTLDGSEPTTQSPLYTGPVPSEGVRVVKARLFSHGHHSLITYLYL